jgi:aspartate aminotransferase
MSYLATRLAAVKPSASMAASMAAKALRATGIDVIDLGLGEPDFPTPAHIAEAAYKAALAGETLYTPAAGTLALRRAVADKFRRVNGGDEAILPAPYFVSYPEMVKLLGGVPVMPVCNAETGFRLTPAVLEATITPRTKWLFLNMPGNPSGAVYSAAELQALGAVLERHPQVLILSDEIYEHILFDGRTFVSFGQACPDLRDRTLIVNGVAKAYAMTGWRVGYAAGPVPLLKAMTTVQSQSVTSVAAPMQAAALAALTGQQDCIPRFREAFERRRNLVVAAIASIPGLTLSPPEGAFYAYIGCAGLIGRSTPQGKVLATDTDVTDYLLHHAHVGTVAGAAYGLSPYFRISTATADATLTEATARIARAVAALS